MKAINVLRLAAGLAVLAVIIGVIVWPKTEEAPVVMPTPVAVLPSPSPAPQIQTVNLLITGDLENLVNDPAFQARLLDQFRLRVRYRILSDREMQDVFIGSGRVQLQDVSAMWMSNELTMSKIHAVDEENKTKGSGEAKIERQTFMNYYGITITSPIVLYTSTDIADAFVKENIVTVVGNTYYVTDMPKLLDLVEQQKEWKDLGLPYYGPVTIIPTDPTESGVGMSWMAIVTRVRLGRLSDEPVNLGKVQPSINKIVPHDRLLERDPATLLSKFIGQSGGGYPIIVGYEGGLNEYVLKNPDSKEYVRQKMRILYPQPTISATHPLMTISRGEVEGNEGYEFGAAVSRDPELRRIIWQNHGQRTGFVNLQNEADATILNLMGIPERVAKETGLPQLKVMNSIIAAWKAAE